jgi:hypothetical protein
MNQGQVAALQAAATPSYGGRAVKRRRTKGHTPFLSRNIVQNPVGGTDGMAWEVRTDSVPYAKFFEYGTGQRGGGPTFNGEQKGELPAGYAYGPSAGMAARPFMAPAVAEEEDQFRTDIKQLVREALRDR